MFTARSTNRFAVRDFAAFYSDLTLWGFHPRVKTSEPGLTTVTRAALYGPLANTVQMFADTEDGTWWTPICSDEDSEWFDVLSLPDGVDAGNGERTLLSLVARHLIADEVAIFMGVDQWSDAHEITGRAWAVTSADDPVTVALVDIFTLAAERFGIPAEDIGSLA